MTDTTNASDASLPHARSVAPGRLCWIVFGALIPAAASGVWFFGSAALITMLIAVVSAVGFEFAYRKALGKASTIHDGSAALIGLLFALTLPAATPWWAVVYGCGFAIVFGKQLFGGWGYTIFNPVLIGRVFLLVSYPRAIASWTPPLRTIIPIDGLSAATPLGMLKAGGVERLLETYGTSARLHLHLLLGSHGGAIGETSIIPLLLGAGVLIATRVVTWHAPIAFLCSAALFAWVFGGACGICSGDALTHLLSGGMILGAFFFATDRITTPIHGWGRLFFGMGCGLITMIIRLRGTYPEGVGFSILIMNCFAPILDRIGSRESRR